MCVWNTGQKTREHIYRTVKAFGGQLHGITIGDDTFLALNYILVPERILSFLAGFNM